MNRKLVLGSAILGTGLLLSACAELGAQTSMGGPRAMEGGHQNQAAGNEHNGHGNGQGMQGGMAEGHGADGDMQGMHERMQGMHDSMHDVEADQAAAVAVLQAYSNAINVEDVDAMAAQVVADERFSVIEGRGTNIGWADYRDHHIGPEFASERIDFHVYGYNDIDVRVGHMFAYATFTYAFEATLDGEPYNKDGRGTAVLMRTPDGWRIRHIQTS